MSTRVDNAFVPTPPATEINVAASVRKHKFIAIAVFMVTLAAGIIYAYRNGQPNYRASAVVFVSPRFIANLEDNKELDLQSNTQYRDYVQQNVRTINRFDIIEEAVNKLGADVRYWQRPDESKLHAIERLQGSLIVAPVPDTYQISVSLDGDKPQGLAQIVNTVVDTYLQKVKAEGIFGSDARLENLKREREQLAGTIAAEQGRHAELAAQLAVANFDSDEPNSFDHLVGDARQALAESTRQRIQAEAQLAAATGGEGNPAASVIDTVRHDPALTNLDAFISQRRAALLSATAGLSSEHPTRRVAERELVDLDRQREQLFQKLLAQYQQTYVEQRRADVARTREAESRLAAEAAKQISQAAWFAQRYQEANNLELNMERERKRLNTIDDRIDFLSLETHAPGFVRLFSEAREPGQPFKGGRRKLAAVAMFLAFILTVAVPVLMDLIDPKVHTPMQLHQVLGFPALGWLLEKQHAGADFASEQITRLAARLCQERDQNGARVFAFTGVSKGNGTSTVVRGLTKSLTSLGVRTLAVEANTGRPDTVSGDRASRSLSVVLQGQSDLSKEVHGGNVQAIDHLAADDSSRPSDLQNLVAILRQVPDVYSMVLVDLAPVALSADAEVVARSADVVVLIGEAGRVTKKELRSAATLVERLRPAGLAAVLNRVDGSLRGSFGERASRDFYGAPFVVPSVWKSRFGWS